MLIDFPPNFSLTIEGEIREDNGTVIEVEFKEYHGSREHVLINLKLLLVSLLE
jgi:hypothetical protein